MIKKAIISFHSDTSSIFFTKRNIANDPINDNTITGLNNKDRDDLYISLNKKLTAMNLIESINNLSNKKDFTDYINYIVISEDGTTNTYNFNNIEQLPYLISAEKPEDVVIKANSLDINKVKIDIKSKKSLVDGKINDIDQINYFNDTHIATTIDANPNAPVVQKNYHGGENFITDTMYRFSGNYVPLFYDIELFKKDNSTKYNEMQIALNLETTQNLIFLFNKDGKTVEKTYKIYAGASYSYVSNTVFTVAKSPVVRRPFYHTYDEYTGIPMRIETEVFVNESQVLSQSNTPPAFATLQSNGQWGSGALEGDRYIVGPNPTGDWSGTYSMLGTSSIFYKANSVATLLRGYFDSATGEILPLSSTSLLPIISTWSYWNPSLNNIILVKDTQTSLRFNGKDWVTHVPGTSGFMNVSNFVGEGFYDQIKNIILNESIFSGIEFLFEIHPRNSQYVLDSIFKDYETYDNNQANLGLIRNFNVLSVKYKSTYGDLKLDISQVKPTITVDFIDFDSPGTDIEIFIGATGMNPPFKWAFGYTASTSYNANLFSTQSFATTTYYRLPDTSGSNLVFDIKVIDSIGLTSSVGYYVVNSGNKVPFSGTFSYTTL